MHVSLEAEPGVAITDKIHREGEPLVTGETLTRTHSTHTHAEREREMAAISSINSSFLKIETISASIRKKGLSLGKRASLRVQAAKVPAGLKMPKVEPKLTEPFLGFTNTAEIWNSKACMIGLIGTFIVELILHKGILQIIGVEVGKGLDLPL